MKKNINSINAIYKGQKLTLNAFKKGIFPLKLLREIELLTPKKMFQNTANNSCTSKSS